VLAAQIFRYNTDMRKEKLPAIFGFYGPSRSGKTYLINKLVSQLKEEGHRVAVVKASNQTMSIDTEGKDTALYRKAGADAVIFSSACETVCIVPKALTMQEIVHFLSQNARYDFIFIEGASEEWIPKIRIGEMALRENTLFTYDGDYDALYAHITKHNENNLARRK